MQVGAANAPCESVLGSDWKCINGGYSDYRASRQSPAHRTRTLFLPCKGAAGVVRGCVELEAKAGPKAMNCTFWLLLPARRAIPLFSSGAASCIAFAALDAPEP